MRRKEGKKDGKEEGHLFFLLLHSNFSQNYGIKQQPFYYAYNCVGQEFEREHRGISSSLGHDIRNLPRKTKPRGDSVTRVWHRLKVHSLACLAVNADVCRGFGMIEDQYIYTWPRHMTAWASSQHSAWLPRLSAP